MKQMIYRYYSVYDRKALVYMPPFHAHTDGAAMRSIEDAMADPNTSLARHPDDFVLYYVGDYSDEKGRFFPADPLVHVVDVSALSRVSRLSPSQMEC